MKIDEETLMQIQMNKYKQIFWVKKNEHDKIVDTAFSDLSPDGISKNENLKSLGFEVDRARQ